MIQNYYLVPFILELLIGDFIIILREQIFLGDKVGIITGTTVIVLALLKGYKAFSVGNRLRVLRNSKPYSLTLRKLKAIRSKANLYIGRGYSWQNKHAQKMHDLAAEKDVLGYVNQASKLEGNPLIHGVGMLEEQKVFVPTSKLNSHTVIAGTTRVGKTRLLELLIAQAIMRNEIVIVIDPKGDNQLLDRIYDVAVKSGRENDFCFFSLIHPRISLTYNPLDNFLKSSDVASRITSIMPQNPDSKPFTDFAWKVLLEVTESLLSIDVKPTLEALHRYSLEEMEQLKNKVHTTMTNTRNESKRAQLKQSYAHINALYEHPHEHFSKMITSLEPALSSLSSGEVGTLLSAVPSDITWDKVISKNKIIYMYLGSMIDRAVASNVGKMALQDLLFYIGMMYGNYEGFTMPINIFIDEFYNVVFDGYVDLLSKAGGAGARVTLALQTTTDIESVMKVAQAKQILANCNNKIFLRVPERKIAETFTDLYGKVTIRERLKTISVSPDVKDNDTFFNSSYGERLMPREINLIESEYIMHLPIGQAFMFTQGKSPYKLRLPLIRDKINYCFTEKMSGVSSAKKKSILGEYGWNKKNG
jgi:conjugal transfer pilus assembly protein TraD